MKQELEREAANLKRLRDDAIERGMTDLAVAYGWSAIEASEALVVHAAFGLAAVRTLRERRKSVLKNGWGSPCP